MAKEHEFRARSKGSKLSFFDDRKDRLFSCEIRGETSAIVIVQHNK